MSTRDVQAHLAQWPGWAEDLSLAREAMPGISSALTRGLDTATLASQWRRTHPVEKSRQPKQPTNRAPQQSTAALAAAVAVLAPAALAAVLVALYAKAYLGGVRAALKLVGRKGWSLKNNPYEALGRLPRIPGLVPRIEKWTNEIPNSHFESLVAAAQATASQITYTSAKRAAAVLSSEEAKFLSVPRLRLVLEEAVQGGNETAFVQSLGGNTSSVQSRAWTIALTETVRGMATAANDVYGAHTPEAAGLFTYRPQDPADMTGNDPMLRIRWRTAEDPSVCHTYCIPNQRAGAVPWGTVFPSGDRHPPAHTRCRCAIVLA